MEILSKSARSWPLWLVLLCGLFPACRVVPVHPGRAPEPTARAGSVERWPERYLPIQWEVGQIADVDFSDRGEFGRSRVFTLDVPDAPPGEEKILIACQHQPKVSGSGQPIDIHVATISVQVHQQNFTVATLFEPESSADFVGLVTYLTTLDGITKQERAVIDELRRRGWFVAAIEPHALLRVGEHAFFSIDGSDKMGIAEPYAKELDRRLADFAYFAESTHGYLRSTRPRLRDCPVVLIGASAGAIALPTVAARVGKPDAAVLIGGGANFAAIVTEFPYKQPDLAKYVIDESRDADADSAPMSTTNNDGVQTIYKLVPFNRRDRRQLAREALPFSKLDPYHTAVELRGVPTLMLHARFDRIVPASTGRLYYEALGRPERWNYPLGHLGLFGILPQQARRIADWVDGSVQQLPTASGS